MSGSAVLSTTPTRPQGRTAVGGAPVRRPSFGDYHPDDVVSRKIAAALIGVSPRTTEDWARAAKGPKFCKLCGTGRSARVVYRVGDLLDWLDAQTRVSTTDPEVA